MGLLGVLRSFWGSEDAVSAIEYALIAALIAVAALGAVSAAGDSLSSTFTTASAVFISPS